MELLADVAFVLGIILIGVANLGLRRRRAPAVGGSGWRLPWQGRELYRGPGYALHLTGLTLWLVALTARIVF